MADTNNVLSTQVLELRRGVIVLAILSQLRAPQYGYGLLQNLENSQVPIDAGTLYPLLRRFERQGILESEWESTEPRPRKYYRLSIEGERLYRDLIEEWMTMTKTVTKMISEEQQ